MCNVEAVKLLTYQTSIELAVCVDSRRGLDEFAMCFLIYGFASACMLAGFGHQTNL
jgi:hypothetical protein